MTAATVRTVWFRSHDPDLHTDVLRPRGYKAVAGTSWVGPFRWKWQEARADARAYNAAGRQR